MDTRERLAQLAISPSGFVFDPSTGSTFTVNTTGRLILEGIRDGQSLCGLAAVLSEHFDTTHADLDRDVLEYVRLLREGGLVSAHFELR